MVYAEACKHRGAMNCKSLMCAALWMSPSEFVQIRDAISQECHRFLRPIEDFSELGDSLLRPGTHHHDLNVPADGRQIVDQLEGNFSGALKLIHKLLP